MVNVVGQSLKSQNDKLR